MRPGFGKLAVAMPMLLLLLLPAAATVMASSSATCGLVGGVLLRGTSSRGRNLTPEGLGGGDAASAEACLAACCAHALCVAFTRSSFQHTPVKQCAHGRPCCWLKGGSFVPATGDANETSGQVSGRGGRACPPCTRPASAEIYTCHAGTCQGSERGNAPGRSTAHPTGCLPRPCPSACSPR